MAEGGSPAHILVVDDNRMNRMKLARAVEQLGYRASIAPDGAAALLLLAADGVDAVLLDLVMPEVDGYAVLERMQADPQLREIPVIVVTAVDDTASVVRCLELGADDHLPKDVHPLVLRARLRAGLARKERRDLERRLLAQEVSLRQQEKLVTLGRLAAGFAHELNNPASSARRSASQLGDAIDRLQHAQIELARVALDDDQIGWLDTRVDDILAQGRDGAAAVELGPLERADRHDRLGVALRSLDVARPEDVVADLAAAGVEPEDIAAAATLFGPAAGAAVGWVAAAAAVAGLVDQTQTAAARITELVDRLKRYSYMDQAPEQDVDVHAGLEDTLTMLRRRLDGITVRRELAADLPRIVGRGSELNDAWTHLLDNAVDAMGGTGTLTLRTYQEEGTVLVEIEDDGSGIPSELLPRVFDPFVTTKPPGEGTGLGLNAVHTVVSQRHGGSITVDSEPGRTRFTVRLPIDGPDPDLAPPEDPAATPTADMAAEGTP